MQNLPTPAQASNHPPQENRSTPHTAGRSGRLRDGLRRSAASIITGLVRSRPAPIIEKRSWSWRRILTERRITTAAIRQRGPSGRSYYLLSPASREVILATANKRTVFCSRTSRNNRLPGRVTPSAVATLPSHTAPGSHGATAEGTWRGYHLEMIGHRTTTLLQRPTVEAQSRRPARLTADNRPLLAVAADRSRSCDDVRGDHR